MISDLKRQKKEGQKDEELSAAQDTAYNPAMKPKQKVL